MVDFAAEYAKMIPNSIKEAERARKLTPGGVSSSIGYWAPSPMYIDRSEGAYLWDVDGNRFIDFSMCYAAMIAGHANPIIAEAVGAQANRPITALLYGLPRTPNATESGRWRSTQALPGRWR